MSPEGTNKAEIPYTRSEEGHAEELQVPINQLHSPAVGAFARESAQFRYLAEDKQLAGGPPRDTQGHVFPTCTAVQAGSLRHWSKEELLTPTPFSLLNVHPES